VSDVTKKEQIFDPESVCTCVCVCVSMCLARVRECVFVRVRVCMCFVRVREYVFCASACMYAVVCVCARVSMRVCV
jgi:hypothetical protein